MASLTVLYGLVVYLFFLITFLYAIGFVGNLPLLPRTIDSGHAASFIETLVVDLTLWGLFAVPHSMMAGRGFKRGWNRVIPESMQRSTHLLPTGRHAVAQVRCSRPQGTGTVMVLVGTSPSMPQSLRASSCRWRAVPPVTLAWSR